MKPDKTAPVPARGQGGYRPAHLLVITTAIFASMQPAHPSYSHGVPTPRSFSLQRSRPECGAGRRRFGYIIESDFPRYCCLANNKYE